MHTSISIQDIDTVYTGKSGWYKKVENVPTRYLIQYVVEFILSIGVPSALNIYLDMRL